MPTEGQIDKRDVKLIPYSGYRHGKIFGTEHATVLRVINDDTGRNMQMNGKMPCFVINLQSI